MKVQVENEKFYQIDLIKVKLVTSNHLHLDNESEKTV